MSSEQLLQQAQSTLWLPGALDEPGLVRVMDSMLAKGADFADLYFEKTLSESWSLEDGIVKDGSFNVLARRRLP